MRARVLPLLAALVAALAAAAAATAETVHLSKTPIGAFPKRVWLVSLPKGERIQRSQVSVSENGRRVERLGVGPAGAVLNTRTVLVIDSSNSMAGKPERGE